MTVEPDRFDEAIEEFASRRLVTRQEADEISDYAKRRAWWISGVAQLDVVADAHSSLLKAMEKGVPFETWKKEVEGSLTKAWGRKDSPRIELIWRNATMQAANAGRYRQMTAPHVAAARPYLEYDATRDGHTCHICSSCHGVLLPIDHPWWQTHSPILHHKCRCGLRSKRRSYATDKGITQSPPDVEAGSGFGTPPDKTEPPKPWARSEPPDPQLEREFAAKTYEHESKVTHKAVTVLPEHDPGHWEEYYRPRYGEAAKQVGHGRALLERSKLLTDQQVLDGLDELRKAGVIGTEGLALAANRDAARLMVEHTRTLGVRHVPDMDHDGSPEIRAALRRNRAWWSRMSAPSLELPSDTHWMFAASGDRSGYEPDTKLLTLRGGATPGAAIHEYGHAVEHLIKAASSKAFIEAKTRGWPLEKLSVIYDDPRYEDHEVARRDHLWEYYAGKDYTGLPYTWSNEVSECVSQGTGDIADGQVATMLRGDPDSVLFLIGWLRGV